MIESAARPLFLTAALALALAAPAFAAPKDKAPAIKPVALEVKGAPAKREAKPPVVPADNSEREIWRHHGMG